ncbi:MAG: S41 family peptidase [Bacteroidales bacterium]|nr:S41 family peptidase [Bacteroidales bacterium]
MNIKRILKLGRKKLIVVALVIVSGTLFAFTIGNEFQLSKNLEIYFSVIRNLNQHYVDGINPDKLIKKSIDAMLEDLDPYTTFIPEDEVSDLQFITTGKYGGIGSSIRMKGEYVMIAEPYENTPACKAGLKAGDLIVAIDGVSTKDKNSSDVSSLLKGTPGTDLEITVKRHGKENNLKFIVTRQEIAIPTIQYYDMLTDSIGYINLSGFKSNSINEFIDAYNHLKENDNFSSLVIDLRGNLGGLLNQSVEIANLFIDKDELIVYTKGRDEDSMKEYKTISKPLDTKIPIVFLTSRSSASASEILAGSFQDLDRGVIVGQRTFGKGLVQKTMPMSYNTILKVTSAKYYIPSGRCVQAIDFSHRNDDGSVGLIPDSLISEFKTRNGRIVKDGGGVTPDIVVTPEYLSKLSVELLRQDIIFDYVTEFCAENGTIPATADFNISDSEYEKFVAFAKKKDFSFETETEKEIEKVIEIAKKEKYYEKSKEIFDKLKGKFSAEVFQDFYTFKEEISQMLKQEIVTRYYYRAGLIEASVSEDKTVHEAIRLLRNPQEYKKILKK